MVIDVLGCGVGMDVVKCNIQLMGGYVEIMLLVGCGMIMWIVLLFMLVIFDGMLVKVGSEIFILLLNFVMELLQLLNDDIYMVGNGECVVCVCGEYLLLVVLYEVFLVEDVCIDLMQGIVMIMEIEGCCFVMLIDELVGQQQVVVKNFEINYCKVYGILVVIILGDGSVVLIVDVVVLNCEICVMYGVCVGVEFVVF